MSKATILAVFRTMRPIFQRGEVWVVGAKPALVGGFLPSQKNRGGLRNGVYFAFRQKSDSSRREAGDFFRPLFFLLEEWLVGHFEVRSTKFMRCCK
jgi:hypothetical protein